MKRTGTIFKNIGRPMALFLCVALLLLSACGQSGSEENRQQVEHEEAPFISTEEMLADYDYMWYIIETQFPFLEEAKRTGYLEKRGIDPEKIKETYRKRIIAETQQFDKDPYDITSSLPVLGQYKNSKEAIYTLFSGCLSQFKGLGHLQISMLDPHTFNINVSEKAEKFYTAFGNSGNIEPLDEYDPNEYMSLNYVKDIPVITIKRFENGNDSAKKMIELSEKICERVINEKCEDLIIDIRGNPGGNSAVWQKGMNRLFELYEKKITVVGGLKAGCLDFFGSEISKKEYALYKIQHDEVLKEYGNKDILTALENAGMDYISEITGTLKVESSNKQPYKGKIWLLVDEKCASSSEMLVLFCKLTGAAIVVGKQTAGMSGQGFVPIFKHVELPNSGMMMMFHWIMYIREDCSFDEFSGTIPDIETEDDALEVCLNIIEKGKSV